MEQSIQIEDKIAGGDYANAMQVSFNPEEFHLMFISAVSSNGRMVSKIITSPGHLKRMVNILGEALKKYEEKNGEIKESKELHKEIGFNTDEQKKEDKS